ncbi:MAG: GNAT family N-acetyltransferase [Phycisphaerae bacterium]
MSQSSASALLRAKQALYHLLMDKHTLDWGIAFWNPQWDRWPEAAQFREVVIPEASRFSEAFEAAEAFFHEQGMLCQRWAPAVDQPVEALEAFLTTRGFVPREMTVMRLGAWPEPGEGPDVRVLPARPMRQAFERTYLIESQDDLARARARAALEYLDEASMSLFVAMRGDEPMGRGGLFEVGDVGLIVELYVIPSARRQGIGRAVMTQLVAMARRAGLRMVCAEVPAGDPAGATCLESCGFVQDGQVREYDRTGR